MLSLREQASFRAIQFRSSECEAVQREVGFNLERDCGRDEPGALDTMRFVAQTLYGSGGKSRVLEIIQKFAEKHLNLLREKHQATVGAQDQLIL